MDEKARRPSLGSDELPGVSRLIVDAVPRLVDQLVAARSGRLYRAALELLERPLLAHALTLAGGNQLRAARLLGLNRNTLRKRCRQLGLVLPRGADRLRRRRYPTRNVSRACGAPGA